jgi:hypothetical protein
MHPAYSISCTVSALKAERVWVLSEFPTRIDSGSTSYQMTRMLLESSLSSRFAHRTNTALSPLFLGMLLTGTSTILLCF